MTTQIQTLADSVKITYTVISDITRIQVTSLNLGSLIEGSTISTVIDELNTQIRLRNEKIVNYNKEITDYQKIYDNPVSTLTQKQVALTDIKNIQNIVAIEKTAIKEANIAITGIKTQGKTILSSLAPKLTTGSIKPSVVAVANTPPITNNISNNKITGQASDDSGTRQVNAIGVNSTSSGTTFTPKGPTPGTTSTESNATAPVKSTTSVESSTAIGRKSTQDVIESSPGKRLSNPLGEFASYTYQLSLYMITPDAYEAFVASGKTKINVFSNLTAGADAGGAFLIAQSGGINNTSAKRAPGFQYDYGIDNLQIKHAISGKTTQSATTITDIKFTITEPSGFSFIDNLKKAQATIEEYSGKIGKNPQNPARGFFILGIRFFGYDAFGNIVSSNLANSLDPSSVDGSLFERFYDITINTIKFKIDGKLVTYTVSAKAMSGNVFSVSRGMINTDTSITANTVGEALVALFEKLNKEQEDLAKGTPPNIQHPNKYDLVWLPGTDRIRDASIVSPADLDKNKWPGSSAKTSAQSTPALEIKQQTPTTDFRSMTFGHGTTILTAINTIITQSKYLEDALSVVYTTDLEADPKKKDNNQIKENNAKNISWYNVTAEITGIKWDELTSDWAYTMRYLIQVYETPVVDSVYVESGKFYPGPHKRYDYWYTGKNSEILQYEHTLDHLYSNAVLSAARPASSSSNAGTETPKMVGKFTNQPRLGRTGYGLEAQNSYLTSLNDPKSFGIAKISILGDPDYLIAEPTSSINQVYNRYYGTDGYSVNANGGQVFFEIDFKEAIDYVSGGSSPGTLTINDSIQFWKYPENISKKIKGVSYTLITCNSTFVNGAFKQTLEAVINDFGTPKTEVDLEIARESLNTETNTNQTGISPSNPGSTTTSTGTKVDPNFSSNKPNATLVTQDRASPSQPTTNTGIASTTVADDDG